MINKSLSLGLLSGLTFALAAPALAGDNVKIVNRRPDWTSIGVATI
jgi:hypothetical protein